MTRNKSFLIAFFATVVRYYNYALFGLAAGKLSEVFFSAASDAGRLLHFFAVFTIASYMRPIGSMIFGFIGDHYGRVVSVKIAASLAVISTIGIASIPHFKVIGYAASLALLCARSLFMVSIAGEIDAIRVYIGEKVGVSRRHFGAGVVSCCSQIGALMAAASYYCAINIDASGELWRVSFIIGGVLGLMVLYLHDHFAETEEFLAHKNNPDSHKWHLHNETMRKYLWLFVVAIVINGVIGGIYNFIVIFFVTFGSKVAGLFPVSQAQYIALQFIIAYGVAALISGWLAEKISPKVQLFWALSASIIIGLVMMLSEYFVVGFLTLSFLAPLYIIPLQVLVQSSFPVRIRMRFVSLSHSIGSAIFSATISFLCMLLWKYTASVLLVCLVYIILIVTLIIAGLLIFKLLQK